MRVPEELDQAAIDRWTGLPPIGTKATKCEFCGRSFVRHCATEEESTGCGNRTGVGMKVPRDPAK